MFFLAYFRVHSTRKPAFCRVAYFILRAYTGTGVSHSQRKKKNSGEVLEKKNAEISKEEIPGSKRSMYGYILTYSRL